MTLTSAPAASDQAAETEPEPAGREARRLPIAPIGLAALVALMAQVPLLHNRAFYFWDDSAAQFIPAWRHIGEQVRAGTLPMLAPEWWVGGNFAAEALFGLWNPLCLLAAVVVSLIPNLAIAAALVKTAFLVVMALGVYALAREYGSGPAPAVLAGAAVPFAGFTLYFDAGAWASGLIATSLVPHLWWTTRRSARGALTPLAPFVAGYLTITTGNPYAALGACLVFGALLVEFAIGRRWAGLWRTLLAAAATGLCVPIVYLPLLGTSAVTVRAEASLHNSGFMVPGLADVLNASAPTFLPHVATFGPGIFTVPATFVAWWLLPLVPWLRWGAVAGRARVLAGLVAFATVALAMAVGPSQVWMFRWPMRIVPFVALAAAVLVAVVLSEGVRTDRWRWRAAASAIIVLAGGYLAFAARPDRLGVHVAGTALVLGLTAGLVVCAVRRPRLVVPVLVAGGAVVLVAQTTWFPTNANVSRYDFPTSVARLQADFAGRYPGTVLQVANGASITARREPQTYWRHLLFGSMLHTAGVDSVNTYTGMNYRPFADALCLSYQGTVCPEALDLLWRQRPDGRPPLADLLRLDTVVVQNDLPGLRPFAPPPGWRLAEHDDIVSVYRRESPQPWAGSRVSAASGGLRVTPVSSGDDFERVRVDDGGGSLTFARLAWPGYRAQAGGVELPVGHTEEGLLVVDVPAGVTGELDVRWTPPGRTAGLLALLAAAMLALGHATARLVART